MKLRKLQRLKSLEEDPDIIRDQYKLCLVKGMVDLFEWKSVLDEILGDIEKCPEIIRLYQEEAEKHCPGYLCSCSPNFMIEDESQAEAFEISDTKGAEDMRTWALISVCAYVRNLADIYRDRDDVRDLVDKIIDEISSDDREKISFKNILEYGDFMSDFELEDFRNQFIKYHQAHRA